MGTLNLINFEAQVIGSDILYKVVMICVTIYVLFKIIEVVVNKIELKEKEGLKVLRIKRYSSELIKLSIICCVFVPVINYVILWSGTEFIVYGITDIINRFLGIVLVLEMLTIFDLILVIKINRIINKYNSEIKSKFVLISYMICAQYILFLFLFGIFIFKIKLPIQISSILSVWMFTWVTSFCFYLMKYLIYSVMNKANLLFYTDRIELVIKTSHYHKYEFVEKMLIYGQLKNDKDSIVIIGDNSSIRKIKRDWIESINILKADGSIRRSIGANTIKNTIIDYTITKKRKIIFKRKPD